MILKAIQFACKKHSKQSRSDNVQSPYVVHPIDVYNRMVAYGITDESWLIAALLHDTIEDTDTTYDEIADNFTLEIADLVMYVTDDKSLPKDQRKLLQIQNAPMLPVGAQWIKYFDKKSNLATIDQQKFWPQSRIANYKQWAWNVIQALPDIPEKLKLNTS